MRRLAGLSIALFEFIFPTAAHALGCESYLGRTISPQTFDKVVMRVAAIPSKGKSEAAVQYESRKAAALPSALEPLIIAKEPEAQHYFQYDEHAQSLGVVEFAFANKSFNSRAALEKAGYSGLASEHGTDYKAVIEQVEKGPATGPLQITSRVIFQGPAPYNENEFVSVHLFPAAAQKPYLVGSLPMTAAEAKALTPHLKLAYVIVPKRPYFVEGEMNYRAIPHLDEVDIAEHFQVLVADFKCGLVLTDSGKVLGAYPTR